MNASGTTSLKGGIFTGGGQVGYNWQHANLVFGGEVDLESFRFSKSSTVTSTYVAIVPGVPFTTGTSVDTDWLLTVRGRLGWTATPTMLIYATGGAALARLNVANSFIDFNGAAFGTGASVSSRNNLGWTAGAGVEWMMGSAFSLKAKYLFVDLGHGSTSATVAPPALPGFSSTLTTSADLTAQVLRVGLNYRFH